MKFYIVFILYLSPLFYIGQQVSNLNIHHLEDIKIDKSWYKKLDYKNFKSLCFNLRIDLINQGYLTCSIDSIVKVDSLKKADAYFFVGEKYDFSEIQFDEASYFAFQETEGIEFWKRKINSSPNRIGDAFKSVISYYENHGFPFVNVRLDSLNWNGNVLNATMTTNKGNLIRFREIIVKTEDDIDNDFVTQVTGIKKNDVFSIEKIQKIEKIIKELPYLDLSAPTEYEILNNKCDIYVYLKRKNANSFNAILGVLPSDNGGLTITGDAKIKLQNVLKKGEIIDFNWRKLLPLTQNLNIYFKYPYLFKSSFGIDTRFDLYKKDTSYLDLNTRIGVNYEVNPELSVNIFYNNRTSSLLSTEKYQFVSSLPNFADVSSNSYGLNIRFENLNYIYNPIKGWDINLEGSVGEKVIKKNIALNPELYEGLDLRTTQFNINGSISRFIRIKKRSTILLKTDGGWLISKNIFENELFRLGGIRNLRGFDDESIFASSFILGTFEYRFILDENSNLFAFSQAMYYDKSLYSTNMNDTPYSFGAGINFQTGAGIFSVSYSLGSQLNNPILLRTAKLHFGFVNYF